MKVKNQGHVFELDWNKEKGTELLTFFKDPNYNMGSGHSGTTNQEVLRALISRVHFLQKQIPTKHNIEIIKCLRKALILHEIRHLERVLERDLPVETIDPFFSGHFIPELDSRKR